jgi:hypothetical protein
MESQLRGQSELLGRPHDDAVGRPLERRGELGLEIQGNQQHPADARLGPERRESARRPIDRRVRRLLEHVGHQGRRTGRLAEVDQRLPIVFPGVPSAAHRIEPGPAAGRGMNRQRLAASDRPERLGGRRRIAEPGRTHAHLQDEQERRDHPQRWRDPGPINEPGERWRQSDRGHQGQGLGQIGMLHRVEQPIGQGSGQRQRPGEGPSVCGAPGRREHHSKAPDRDPGRGLDKLTCERVEHRRRCGPAVGTAIGRGPQPPHEVIGDAGDHQR